MGIVRKVIAMALMMLIIIGGCGVLLCELHDCCHGIHQTKHTCCSSHNHATEGCESHAEHSDDCAMHTQALEHRCHEVLSLNVESTIKQREVKSNFGVLLYLYLYNLLLPLEDESLDHIAIEELVIDCYSPSDGLLRAPPALV